MSDRINMHETQLFWAEDFEPAFKVLCKSLPRAIKKSHVFDEFDIPEKEFDLLVFTIKHLKLEDMLDLVDHLPFEEDADSLLADLWLENHPEAAMLLDFSAWESAWYFLSAFFCEMFC